MAENLLPRIICFGDSNTYGAHGFTGGRYSRQERWTGLLTDDPLFSGKYEFINMGENGRAIPSGDFEPDYECRQIAKNGPAALLIIMLGTNDLLSGARGLTNAVSKMDGFLQSLLAFEPAESLIGGDASRLLLLAPVRTDLARYGAQGARFDDLSGRLGGEYCRLAERLGAHFADAGSWGVQTGQDGVHFTEKGHKTFAGWLKLELAEILGL